MHVHCHGSSFPLDRARAGEKDEGRPLGRRGKTQLSRAVMSLAPLMGWGSRCKAAFCALRAPTMHGARAAGRHPRSVRGPRAGWTPAGPSDKKSCDEETGRPAPAVCDRFPLSVNKPVFGEGAGRGCEKLTRTWQILSVKCLAQILLVVTSKADNLKTNKHAAMIPSQVLLGALSRCRSSGPALPAMFSSGTKPRGAHARTQDSAPGKPARCRLPGRAQP